MVKPLLLFVIIAALVGGAAVLSVLAQPAQQSVFTGTTCQVGDAGCEVTEGLKNLIVPFIFPLILLLVAFLILPKAGPKGVFVALVLVFTIVLWYLGIPGVVGPLRSGGF